MSQGQVGKTSSDLTMIKALGQNILYPYCHGCDSSGLSLVKVYKYKDSLRVRSLYASDSRFNLEEDMQFIRRLNLKYKQRFSEGYTAIVPIYFYYYSEREVPDPIHPVAKSTLESKIKELTGKVHILKPITVAGYQIVR